jgi:hypothetical protein
MVATRARKLSPPVGAPRRVGVMLAGGGAIGLGAALGLGEPAASLLFRLTGDDPTIFPLAGLVLETAALGAAYLVPAPSGGRTPRRPGDGCG